MDNIQELLKDATDYLSSGNVKDAYFSYISALDVVTRELHSIKFVNNVVTSKPASLSSIFALSRTCLSYAEDIIVKHQTPPIPRRNPNLNIAIFPPTPQQEEHPHNLSPHRAPPIPPKPMRRSFNKVGEDGSSSNYPKNEPPALKPPLPPKPVRTASMKKYLVDIEVSGSGRDAHVVSGEGEDDDADSSDSDDDDDDDYVERNGSYLRRSESSLDVAIPQTSLRRRSSSPGRVVTTSRRRPTLTGSITGSITDSPTDEESPYSSHLTSPTTPASFYGAIAVPVSMPNLFEQRPKMISVIPEGAVDPNNLVPAIVSTESENAQSPSSPSSSQYSYHVPEIPASPLITQHTQFEQKIQTLETKLAEYRAISKKREAGNSESDSDELSRTELPDEEINEAIEKYGTTVAGLKQTITRSRKLVYKAAADPDILEFAPHMIAYQLTLIESAIFLEIDPTTLLTHSAKSPDSKITASTDFFNYLTRVVERSILLPLEASSRAQIINHWVKVAVKLHELHNFQTLKAILAALGTPPIKRLKRTWACIPKKSMVRLEALCDMMSETRNYGKYRETIQREGFLRKPTIPFLGTFIMDATYLLAAVKSAGSSNSVSSSNNNINHVPTTPRSTTSMITLTSPGAMQSLQEDPRVQELLQTMMRYQHGPKYQPIPPVTYIKASTKHFRTASISAALHRSSGYKYNHRSEEEEESIEEKQQLITHYLLTRVWIPEKSVDELSLMREPHKYKNGCRASGTASWSGTPNSIISNASSAYRGSTGSTVGGSGTSTGENASTSSGIGRASSTSGSGDSRPHSLEEGVDAAPTASITSKLDRAGPISDKEVCNVKEKEKEKRNITEKVGNFFFGSRSSMDKARDEKEKEEKNKFSECEKEKDNAETICKVELSRIHAEPTIIMPTPISSNKRTSWRTMRVMFGSYEATETPKSPTAMMRAASHSRSSSSIELVPKSPTATFMKAHGRTTSANSPGAKPFTYAPGISTRRSLEEPRSATPPPLLPKPAALMQRSASASSSSSMGSSASAPGTRNSVGNSNPILIGNMDGIEDFRMALAKKVANEVTAGGGSLERNRQ